MVSNNRRLTGKIEPSQSMKMAFLKKTKLFIFAFLMFVMISGCLSREDITVRMGRRPDTDVLEKHLRVGESTQADVTRHLGEPFGTGRAMLPAYPEPREMWSYYFEGGKASDPRRIMLFIYFKEDRLDGYMWFSSLPE
jgi:hypothetical protein